MSTSRDPYYNSPGLGKQIFLPNVWPDRPYRIPGSVVTEYYYATQKLAASIMEMFALALQLPRAYFVEQARRRVSISGVCSITRRLTTAPVTRPIADRRAYRLRYSDVSDSG